MTSVSLSEDGLFYFPELMHHGNAVTASGSEDIAHLSKVMRKKTGDNIYLTDGRGKLLSGTISHFSKESITLDISEVKIYQNHFERFTVLLPILKNPDRFEFALEKPIELGFTRFVAVRYEHSQKPSVNLERLRLKAIAAMKQSLRTYLPAVEYADSLASLLSQDTVPLYFDQFAPAGILENYKDRGANYLIVIGPEGGFSAGEMEILKTGECYKLSKGRLRAETAVITAASLLANMIDFQ